MWLVFCRAMGMGGFQILFLYVPEAYPTTVRATALGLFYTLARLGGASAPFLSQMVMGASSTAALATFAGVSALGAALCICLPFETAGRVLADRQPEHQRK